MTDTVARWEAWPVGALVAAAGLNTALWYAGAAMPDPVRWLLPWLVTAAAVASVIAIDGSLVATIAGMRAGRRSRWSVVNIVVTAAFTGLAALAAHTLPTIGPWLHGLFALTIVSYAMHLAQPRQDVTIALALREQEVGKREQAAAQRTADLDKMLTDHAAAVVQFNAECDKAMTTYTAQMAEQHAAVDQAWQDLASREQALNAQAADLASRSTALARREAEPIHRTEIVTTEYVEVASARLSWAGFHRIVDMARQADGLSVSTLRRIVAKELEGE